MESYTAQLKTLLLEAGCRFERQGRGDHEIWFSPITMVRFPVDSKIKSRYTANAVLKQAGLPKKF
ncbi:MAG: type II toxin-antitoxin system HicA family toxin [Nitrosomonadales bacterium]|nr:type II toxin-antitoxin system HicA family toxin [Nitrosomonadales bacterium]